MEISNKAAAHYHVEFTARRTTVPAYCNSAVIPIENRITLWLCNARVMCPRIAVALLPVLRHCRDGSQNLSLPIHYDLLRPTCRARWRLRFDTRRHEPTIGTKMWKDSFGTCGHATPYSTSFRKPQRQFIDVSIPICYSIQLARCGPIVLFEALRHVIPTASEIA